MTPSEPQTEYQRCQQRHAEGTTHWHPLRTRAIEREAQGIPPSEALREALTRLADGVDRMNAGLPYIGTKDVRDARAALAASGGIPLIDVELRLVEILDAAEGDGIIGPDYTPSRLAAYIAARLSESSPAEVVCTREEHRAWSKHRHYGADNA